MPRHGDLKIKPKVCLILPDFGISLIDYVQCGCYPQCAFFHYAGGMTERMKVVCLQLAAEVRATGKDLRGQIDGETIGKRSIWWSFRSRSSKLSLAKQ